MKQTQMVGPYVCAAATLMLWSGVVMSADWPKQGTTSYVTHFLLHPVTTIDVGSPGKAVALEMVGTTANTNGGKLMDKMTAHCVAVQIISGPQNYIDGGCVLTDKDGDKIFSTFDTREIAGALPRFGCGTHTITGGSGKYSTMKGKEPFSCAILPTAAGEGWSGMDIEHQLTYRFE